MSSSQSFVRVLGQPLGNAIHICQVTSASTTSKIGLQLSVTQQSGLDRNYRVNISPSIATGFGVWKRLVPYDKTEKFINQNHWAVDLSNEVSESIHTITLRLVRTKEGTPPATTSLKCRVLAFPSVGQSVNFVDSQTTSAEAVNAGIYDGALISQQDGMVGINTDAPSHTLDVLGNTNTSGTYKIGGTDVLTSSALGPNVVASALSTVGNLQALVVEGNVALTGLQTTAGTGNVVYIDAGTGQLSYGQAAAGGEFTGLAAVDDLTFLGPLNEVSTYHMDFPDSAADNPVVQCHVRRWFVCRGIRHWNGQPRHDVPRRDHMDFTNQCG